MPDKEKPTYPLNHYIIIAMCGHVQSPSNSSNETKYNLLYKGKSSLMPFYGLVIPTQCFNNLAVNKMVIIPFG